MSRELKAVVLSVVAGVITALVVDWMRERRHAQG